MVDQRAVVVRRGRLEAAFGSAAVRAVLVLLALTFVFFASFLLRGLTFYEDDIENYYYPVLIHLLNALGRGQLPIWTPTMFAGFPFLADGSAGTFYPLMWVALALPHEAAVMWLIALRTALGGAFFYAFIRTLGVTPTAGLLAALVYAFSGYDVGHWIHLSLSHSVLTLPLALFAVEKAHLATDRRRAVLWLLLAGVASALLWLGVHPQAALISSTCLGLYGAFRTLATDDRKPLVRLARLVVGTAVVGLITAGLPAAQLLPMAELARFSVRSGGIPYAFAASFALPPHNLVTFFWPFAFVTPQGFDWGLTNRWETAFYVGVLPLVLAVLAVVGRRERRVLFWAVLAFVCLWLALGRYVPVSLHYWIYQIPGFSIFRVPARFLMGTDLGLAVLAGYGLDVLARSGEAEALARWRRWLGRGLVAVLVLGSAVAGIAALTPGTISQFLWPLYTRWPRVASWRPEEIVPALQQTWALNNPRFVIAWFFVALSAALLLAWRRLPARARQPGVLAAIAAVDLLLFAMPFWSTASLDRLARPRGAVAQYVIEKVGSDRVWSRRFSPSEPNHFIPFGVRDVNTYGPLASQRYHEYLELARYGANRLQDLMGVRWVVAPLAARLPFEAQGVRYERQRPLAVIAPRDTAPLPAFTLEDPFPARGVRLVGRLTGAATLSQGATSLELVLRSRDGRELVLPVQAGVHMADGDAYRVDVAPRLAHLLPTVATGEPMYGPDGKPYDRLIFVSTVDLPDPGFPIAELTFRNPAPGAGLEVFGLSLVGTDGTLLPSDRLTDTRYVERARDRTSRLLEARTPLPRTFLAGRAQQMAPNGGLLASLADVVTDPQSVVYVEKPLDPALAAAGPVGSSRITAEQDAELTIAVDTPRPALLFVADPYYPGWEATVDGNTTEIYVADYIFRAVAVPAGSHTVKMTYAPLSVNLGLGISGLTLALLLVGGAWLRRDRPQAS